MTQTLQSQITSTERAIRHLIGEEKALKSKLARLDARRKLELGRLRKTGSKLQPGKRFPDVSNNQPNIDLAAAHKLGGAERIGDLVVTKITEGVGFVDQPGLVRAKTARTVGFAQVGGYAFLHPSVGGAAQADAFLRASNGLNLDIIIADLEVSDGTASTVVRGCALSFADEIRKHTQAKLWLYGGGPFLKANSVPLTGYDGHWLAAYVGDPAPFMVYGGARTVAWQFTDGHYGPSPHVCPGIGSCDLSIVL